jgi:hypothetical protein
VPPDPGPGPFPSAAWGSLAEAGAALAAAEPLDTTGGGDQPGEEEVEGESDFPGGWGRGGCRGHA